VDIPLVERWRRWLDDCFRDETIDEATSSGHQMIAILKDMNVVFDDIA
jgi:hypothetical protein